VVPYLSRQVQTLGRAGVAGVMLLVFAVAFFVGANAPLQGELEELRDTLDTARTAHAGQLPAVTAHNAELDNFMAHLPLRSELPALTLLITTQATKAGVELERGTYDVVVTPSGRLARARLSFPVHGRYPDIRRFIDGTLAAIPGAAIDALRFERKNVGDAEIDADVRFALYLRTAP
jgi:Tfp pilus assembly protein PilO